VPRGGIVRQRLLFTPPVCGQSAEAELVFNDSHVPFSRTLRVVCHPEGRTVSDGRSTTGWTCAGGATVAAGGDRVCIRPPEAVTSERLWSEINTGPKIKVPHGLATLALGSVNLDRQPVLEWEVAERFAGRYSARLVSGREVKWLDADKGGIGFVRVDLRQATGWRGTREIALAVDPVESWGDALVLRRVTLVYREP
jgi:hypothetical protein